jgi:probable HAF family extracellular repeat protein
MKSKSATLVCLFAALAIPLAAQQRKVNTIRYVVTDLGTLPGGPFSQASSVNNNAFASGEATLPDGTQHAALWYEGLMGDIGSPALGGPNSFAVAVNDKGQVAGQAESPDLDPYNENFCAYGTGFRCLPFIWQNGAMTQLPLLGGNNGIANAINNRGEVVGIAETSRQDPDCPSGTQVNGTGPQVFDFEPVIWGPRPGQIRRLRPLHGDTVGIAFSINDNGQTVGLTGTCANTLTPGPSVGPHAVLWEKDGSVHDLGNLGGTVDITVPAIGNAALGINNRGQVVGGSPLPGNTANHAFLWTRAKHMQDLGTLPGDTSSVGYAINDNGEVVGISLDSQGDPHPYLWRHGVMIDLNSLVSPDSPLFLLLPEEINQLGEIAGFGVDNNGDVHAFLATPCSRIHGNRAWCEGTNDVAAEQSDSGDRSKAVLGRSTRDLLRQQLRNGRWLAEPK